MIAFNHLIALALPVREAAQLLAFMDRRYSVRDKELKRILPRHTAQLGYWINVFHKKERREDPVWENLSTLFNMRPDERLPERTLIDDLIRECQQLPF